MSNYLFLTSSITTPTIIQPFEDFKQPQEGAFKDMVVHTVNSEHHSPQEVTDGLDENLESEYGNINTGIALSYGRQYMIGQLNLARGNHQTLNPPTTGSDVFHEIAPPFVPNLHPYIRVFSLDGHTVMNLSGSQSHGFSPLGTNTQNRIFCTSHYDDSTTTHTKKNLSGKSNDNDFPYGAIKGITDDGNDQILISTGFNSFSCNKNPWWIKTRFKIADHDASTFFFGLSEEDGTDPITSGLTQKPLAFGGAGKDKIGFIKSLATSDNILINISKNGGTVETVAIGDGAVNQGTDYRLYSNDNDILSLGIYWDGSNTLSFYMNKVATGENPGHMKLVKTITKSSLPDDFPDDSTFRLMFAFESNGTGGTVIMEYMQGAIYTTT
jgi:hypothetical protein